MLGYLKIAFFVIQIADSFPNDPFSQGMAQAQQQQQQQSEQPVMLLKKPPKWLRRPVGASFAVRP